MVAKFTWDTWYPRLSESARGISYTKEHVHVSVAEHLRFQLPEPAKFERLIDNRRLSERALVANRRRRNAVLPVSGSFLSFITNTVFNDTNKSRSKALLQSRNLETVITVCGSLNLRISSC
jgi:hypothetical protein